MPALPVDSSSDELGVGTTHDDLELSADAVERDILDEDGLREDQPYAVLEENPDTFGPQDEEGAGSW